MLVMTKETEPTSLQKSLKALRERSGVPVRKISKEAFDSDTPSSYVYYETRFKKPYIPMHVAVKLADVFTGKGVPAIKRHEVLELAGKEFSDDQNGSPSSIQDPSPNDNMDPPGYKTRMPEKWGANVIPLFAATAAGKGQSIIGSEPIEYIDEPPEMRGIPDAFGIYVHGESMVPALRHGDLLLVHPNKRPRPRDQEIAVFICEDGNGGEECVVKEFIEDKGGGTCLVKQYNKTEDADAGEEYELTGVRKIMSIKTIRRDV